MRNRPTAEIARIDCYSEDREVESNRYTQQKWQWAAHVTHSTFDPRSMWLMTRGVATGCISVYNTYFPPKQYIYNAVYITYNKYNNIYTPTFIHPYQIHGYTPPMTHGSSPKKSLYLYMVLWVLTHDPCYTSCISDPLDPWSIQSLSFLMAQTARRLCYRHSRNSFLKLRNKNVLLKSKHILDLDTYNVPSLRTRYNINLKIRKIKLQ